jgi:chromate transporter
MASSEHTPSLAQAFRFWLKLGFISFGGPAGQIAIMHTELVDKKKWISEDRFLHALNYCMVLPGPEAQQLAIYVGWLLHRTWGGIVAGAFFVIPSIFIMLLLSYLAASFGHVPAVEGVLCGFKPVVIGLVGFAVIRIGKKSLKNGALVLLAAVAFVAIFFFHVAFPLIVIGAGLIGWSGAKFFRQFFPAANSHGDSKAVEAVAINDADHHTRASWSRAFKITAVCAVLYAAVAGGLGWQFGGSSVFMQEAIFFTKAAFVTFGGAYAVLPYVAQAGVQEYGWLSAGQMLDGLALAETTSGPLIMVVQYVGFIGAYKFPGELSPVVSGALGALVTTFVTFLPCFWFIFIGAPHVEQMRGNQNLTAALTGITAAVVGVILNLAVFLGIKVIFPQTGVVDYFAATMALFSFAGFWKWSWPIHWVVLAGGILGVAWKLIVI